jgi:hypothetical protein
MKTQRESIIDAALSAGVKREFLMGDTPPVYQVVGDSVREHLNEWHYIRPDGEAVPLLEFFEALKSKPENAVLFESNGEDTRPDMTRSEKVEFISKHGADAYKLMRSKTERNDDPAEWDRKRKVEYVNKFGAEQYMELVRRHPRKTKFGRR